MKNYVITGATSYIGSALIDHLVFSGSELRIIATYHKRVPAVHRADTIFMQVDLLNENDLVSLRDLIHNEFGDEPFAVVNCAGGFWEHKPFTDLSYKEVVMNFNQNFMTALGVAYHLVPLMPRGSSFVVFGCNSTQHAYPWMAPFSAAKKALSMFMKSLRSEYGDRIRFNTLVLATVDTKREREYKPNGDYNHWLKPDNVAIVVESICNDKSQLINGADIELFDFSEEYNHKGFFERISR